MSQKPDKKKRRIRKKTVKKIIWIAVCILLIAALVYINAVPSGRAQWNRWMHSAQKADDATRYETRKQVEDTCRAMIASYNSDALVWEQYRASADPERREWADMAMMRANKTAVSYNEYVLKNSYVFEGNVPEDIRAELPVLKAEP